MEDFFWNCEISVDVVIEFWFVLGGAAPSALSDSGTAAPTGDITTEEVAGGSSVGTTSLGFDDVEPAVPAV